MARAAVQLAVRSLNEEFRGRLVTEIDKLVELGLITSQLGKNAHEVRILGNEYAHPDNRETDVADFVVPSVTEDDAQDGLAFMEDFLETALAVPERQRRREAARKERNDVATKEE